MGFIAFDQYQRYEFIAQILKAADVENSNVVLEVGGAFSPLLKLLPAKRIITIDRVADDPALDVRADVFHLPFSDSSFKSVVCTDVLEHIEQERRNAFLLELLRVTSRMLILGFPRNDPAVKTAEKILLNFMLETKGGQSSFLEEHKLHGLPNDHEVRADIEPHFKEIFEFNNANVSSWLALLMADSVASMELDFSRSRELMHEIFNQHYASNSHTDPTYRTFFVCFRESVSPDIQAFLTGLQEKANSSVLGYAATSLILSTSFQKELQMVRQNYDSERQRLQTELDAVVSQLDKTRERLKANECELKQLALSAQEKEQKQQKTIMQLEEQNQSLDSEIRRLKQRNQSLTSEVGRLEQRNQFLTSDIRVLEEKNQSLASDIRQLDEKNRSLFSDMARLEEENRALVSRVGDLQKEKESLSSQSSLMLEETKKELESEKRRSQNLQQYLNLFLSHPAYKTYRFFKNVFKSK